MDRGPSIQKVGIDSFALYPSANAVTVAEHRRKFGINHINPARLSGYAKRGGKIPGIEVNVFLGYSRPATLWR